MKLNVTTEQEAYDAVTRHLTAMTRRAMDDEGNCRYRTDDGNRCAIGALIPDAEYDPDIEGKTVGGLFARHHEHLYTITTPRLETTIRPQVLSDLQMVHDSSENWTHDPLTHMSRLNAIGYMALTDVASFWGLEVGDHAAGHVGAS